LIFDFIRVHQFFFLQQVKIFLNKINDQLMDKGIKLMIKLFFD